MNNQRSASPNPQIGDQRSSKLCGTCRHGLGENAPEHHVTKLAAIHWCRAASLRETSELFEGTTEPWRNPHFHHFMSFCAISRVNNIGSVFELSGVAFHLAPPYGGLPVINK